jgi:hypothetical protein
MLLVPPRLKSLHILACSACGLRAPGAPKRGLRPRGGRDG